jgi:hypothetical protein
VTATYITRYPVLCAWLVLAAAVTYPYVRAVKHPPPGQTFAGTFHWIDDAHSYLAYAQQSEDGHVLLRNKFGPPAASAPRPRLVNLEWSAVGFVSRALGREPHLAFRIVGLLAGFLVLAAADAWLVQGGMKATRRLPALLLVSAGGGLGGLLFTFADSPIERCVDLTHGMSAFAGLLSNAHWTSALALTLGALYAFTRFDAGPRAFWYGGLLGSALAFVRPYDVVTVAAARVFAVAVEDPRKVRRLVPLLALGPAMAYQVWVFFGESAYSMHGNPLFASAPPSRTDTLLALAPFALAAVPGLPRRRTGEPWRWPLAGWMVFGLVLLLVRPVGFSMRYAVGLAVPCLCLAALWLASLKARWFATGVCVLCAGAPAAVWMTLAPDQWFVPRERWLVAQALRGACAPGDRMASPPDIGLYASALSECDVYVGYPAEPEYPRRMESLRAFYAGQLPAERLRFLDRECLTHVVVPGIPGPRGEGWVPVEAGFALVGAVRAGQPLSLYRRSLPAACRK